MLRKIIEIDEERCNGCGLCADACHEGAIAMVQGKARLVREDYCDGLGDCLPACPAGAIRFVMREAPAYDAQAVQRARGQAFAGCPGAAARSFAPERPAPEGEELPSQLGQWPVQLKLAPVQAPYFAGASLLVAADCSAFAHGDFHRRFLRGRVALIGCPKLDGVDYSEKLGQILRQNEIRQVTLVRMEVPCCGGLELACRRAIAASGRQIPLQVVTLSVRGEILSEQ